MLAGGVAGGVVLVVCGWVLCAAGVGAGVCPGECVCGVDARGRRRAACAGGVAAAGLDRATQVLEVAGAAAPLAAAQLQALAQLEELRVRRAHLADIGRHALWGLKRLQLLDLAANDIGALHDHNFRGLAELRDLLLDDNLVQRLAGGTFRYLPELRRLSLARNRLRELAPRAFERLAKLHHLTLSGNRLGELLPELFMDIQELRVLECRACGLRNINTQIYHLVPQLVALDLGDNDFFYLPSDEFVELRALRRLWLDGNHLPVVLERTFAAQRDLQLVSLARNRLAKLTAAAFVNASSLADLDVSCNKLSQLEAAVLHPVAESLRRLDVGGNRLGAGELRPALLALPRLRHLGLADLNLTALPPGPWLPAGLVSLNLSGNLLSEWPAGPWLPAAVAALDLSRNRLAGLGERAVQRLARVPALQLHGNPWRCDACHAAPLLALVNASRTAGALCASPRALRLRPLAALRPGDLAACGAPDAADDGPAPGGALLSGPGALIAGTAAGAALLLVGSVAAVRACCFQRRPPQRRDADGDKPPAPPAAAVFGQNGEITFKFPLEGKLAPVATIAADLRKETRLPNGDL